MAEESNGKKRSKVFLLVVSILLAGAFLIPTVFVGVSSLPFFSGAPSSPDANGVNNPQRKQLEDQVRGYESVLQREPKNAIALDGFLKAKLGLIQMGAAKVDEVLPTLEKLVELNPQDSRYAMMLAQVKEQTQDLEGAAQVYREVLKGQPGDLYALAGLSDLLTRQKKPESAISLLKDTLRDASKLNQTTPGSIDTIQLQIMLGKVFAKEKRFDEAINSFDAAAKVNPTDFQPILFKAMTFKEQGKKEEAKTLFDRALTLAPAQYKDLVTRSAAEVSPAPTAPTASTAPGSAPTGSALPESMPSEGGVKPGTPASSPAPDASANPAPAETPATPDSPKPAN
jgi:tetratricopeptide (TPR) repeat protein